TFALLCGGGPLRRGFERGRRDMMFRVQTFSSILLGLGVLANGPQLFAQSQVPYTTERSLNEGSITMQRAIAVARAENGGRPIAAQAFYDTTNRDINYKVTVVGDETRQVIVNPRTGS